MSLPLLSTFPFLHSLLSRTLFPHHHDTSSTNTSPTSLTNTPLHSDAIPTPALIIDQSQMIQNLRSLHDDVLLRDANVLVRPHIKAHKSRYFGEMQLKEGNVNGLCCQKMTELEEMLPLFTEGDASFCARPNQTLLLTNEVVDERRIRQLVQANVTCQGRVMCVVDNKDVLMKFLDVHREYGRGLALQVLVDVNVGQERCGVEPHSRELLELVTEILKHPRSFTFKGIQAYHGANQHIRKWEDRRDAVQLVNDKVQKSLQLIERKTHTHCDIVTGGGTGTWAFEAGSGFYTEIQPGSYIFMDRDYGKNLDRSGLMFAKSSLPSSLFVLSTVISKSGNKRVVLDVGLKGVSLDSGAPSVFLKPHLQYTSGGDEHGILTSIDERPIGLNVGDKVLLVPGHCDPTVNMYNHVYLVARSKGEEKRRTLALEDLVIRRIKIDARGPGV